MTVDGMDIHEVLTAARSPCQNGFAERLIGSIRPECLDQSSAMARGLCRVLHAFIESYHRSRTHLSLKKDAADGRPLSDGSAGSIVALSEVGGVHYGTNVALHRRLRDRFSISCVTADLTDVADWSIRIRRPDE
jgi:hypothetical protein